MKMRLSMAGILNAVRGHNKILITDEMVMTMWVALWEIGLFSCLGLIMDMCLKYNLKDNINVPISCCKKLAFF